MREALAAYEPILRDGDDLPGGALLDACRDAADLPQALAAVDLALWDRAGNREGRPVSALITDDPAASVRVNATIAAEDRAGAAAAAAAAAARAGYSCVKVKVGVGDDAGRVAAVRAAAGPAMELRLDANGAWTVEEAVAAIEALAPAGLELVEEPVHGIEAMRAVRDRVAVRVAMDETAAEPGSLTAAVADAVCLKVSRCGGISGLLAQAALVRASGADVYLASTFDGPLGIAAARPLRGGAAPERRVRARHARALRRRGRGPPGSRRRDRRAGRAGPRRLSARHSVVAIAAATACGASPRQAVAGARHEQEPRAGQRRGEAPRRSRCSGRRARRR